MTRRKERGWTWRGRICYCYCSTRKSNKSPGQSKGQAPLKRRWNTIPVFTLNPNNGKNTQPGRHVDMTISSALLKRADERADRHTENESIAQLAGSQETHLVIRRHYGTPHYSPETGGGKLLKSPLIDSTIYTQIVTVKKVFSSWCDGGYCFTDFCRQLRYKRKSNRSFKAADSKLPVIRERSLVERIKSLLKVTIGRAVIIHLQIVSGDIYRVGRIRSAEETLRA